MSNYVQNCGDCLFWEQDVEGKQLNVGLCRRFPPPAQHKVRLREGVPLSLDALDMLPVSFPATERKDWCGEFHLRGVKREV